jgi:hypothetical protein
MQVCARSGRRGTVAPAATTTLRVADASAFPDMIGANTDATVSALAAKASDPFGGGSRRTPSPLPSPSPTSPSP